MHGNAPMTPRGRMIMIERIAAGRPIAHVAAEMGVSRKTADKWWRRWLAEGEDGLEDRSSRPHRCPHQTPARMEDRIVRIRQRRKLGPARIATIVGVPASTVHRVLCRHGMNRARVDGPPDRPSDPPDPHRPAGRARAHRCEETREDPARWRLADAGPRERRASPLHPRRLRLCALRDRRAQPPRLQRDTSQRTRTDLRRLLGTRPRLLRRSQHHRRRRPDHNAKNYLGKHFTAALDGIEHRRIRKRRPQTNGKVERFNRTLLDEWAYARLYTSNGQRARALDRYLHLYNHHRGHTALGGDPPISHATNLAGQHS